jgi:hypothetical protein
MGIKGARGALNRGKRSGIRPKRGVWGEGQGPVSLGTVFWDRNFLDLLPVYALSTAILLGPHHFRKDLYWHKSTVPKAR